MLIHIHQNDLNHGVVTADEQLFLRGRALSVRSHAIVAGRQWATRGLEPQEPCTGLLHGRALSVRSHADVAGRQRAASAPHAHPPQGITAGIILVGRQQQGRLAGIHARGQLGLFAAGQHRLATYQPHAVAAGRQCTASALHALPPPGL